MTSEKVTVPFSPASKSLANMLVTNDPAGKPAHIWQKQNETKKHVKCELQQIEL